uniref:Tetratricopeptide repeat domain 32 n=1 Tax=Gadus morhua TaxID=8049 RepID=A0A8C5BBY5_GADMO
YINNSIYILTRSFNLKLDPHSQSHCGAAQSYFKPASREGKSTLAPVNRATCEVHRATTKECAAGDLAAAYNSRGQIRYLRVDFTEAMEDYTEAIGVDPRFEIPFYNRGLIHYRLGFFEEAKRDFQQVLKINPDFEEAKVSLLQTLQDQQHRMTRGY